MSEFAAEFRALLESYNAQVNATQDNAIQQQVQSEFLIRIKDLRSRVLLAERSMQDAARVATSQAAAKSHALLHVVSGKGAAAKARAKEKRAISSQKTAVVNDYRALKIQIDDVIRQINTMKATAKVQSAANKRQKPSQNSMNSIEQAPPAPPPPPAGWHVDPTGRNQYRYWDGLQWTSHVSTSGVTGIDQL
jgi:Mg2+ and Co2+ transporter CorA